MKQIIKNKTLILLLAISNINVSCSSPNLDPLHTDIDASRRYSDLPHVDVGCTKSSAYEIKCDLLFSRRLQDGSRKEQKETFESDKRYDAYVDSQGSTFYQWNVRRLEEDTLVSTAILRVSEDFQQISVAHRVNNSNSEKFIAHLRRGLIIVKNGQSNDRLQLDHTTGDSADYKNHDYKSSWTTDGSYELTSELEADQGRHLSLLEELIEGETRARSTGGRRRLSSWDNVQIVNSHRLGKLRDCKESGSCPERWTPCWGSKDKVRKALFEEDKDVIYSEMIRLRVGFFVHETYCKQVGTTIHECSDHVKGLLHDVIPIFEEQLLVTLEVGFVINADLFRELFDVIKNDEKQAAKIGSAIGEWTCLGHNANPSASNRNPSPTQANSFFSVVGLPQIAFAFFIVLHNNDWLDSENKPVHGVSPQDMSEEFKWCSCTHVRLVRHESGATFLSLARAIGYLLNVKSTQNGGIMDVNAETNMQQLNGKYQFHDEHKEGLCATIKEAVDLLRGNNIVAQRELSCVEIYTGSDDYRINAKVGIDGDGVWYIAIVLPMILLLLVLVIVSVVFLLRMLTKEKQLKAENEELLKEHGVLTDRMDKENQKAKHIAETFTETKAQAKIDLKAQKHSRKFARDEFRREKTNVKNEAIKTRQIEKKESRAFSSQVGRSPRTARSGRTARSAATLMTRNFGDTPTSLQAGEMGWDTPTSLQVGRLMDSQAPSAVRDRYSGYTMETEGRE